MKAIILTIGGQPAELIQVQDVSEEDARNLRKVCADNKAKLLEEERKKKEADDARFKALEDEIGKLRHELGLDGEEEE